MKRGFLMAHQQHDFKALNKHAGFTLLEVLVAVSISAMVGIAAVQLLSNVSNIGRATEERSAELAEMQRFNQVLGRDIGQFIDRPIRDEYGDTLSELMLGSGDYPIEFTIAGWRNIPITDDPRSTLQRVAYRTEEIDSEPCEPALERLAAAEGLDPDEYVADGECFIRYYWPVLDQADDTEPKTQVLLDQIDDVEFTITASTKDSTDGSISLNTYDFWPPLTPTVGEAPAAIRLRFTTTHFGEIERVWLIAHDGGLW